MNNVFDIKTKLPVEYKNLYKNTPTFSFIVPNAYFNLTKNMNDTLENYSFVNEISLDNVRTYIFIFDCNCSIDYLKSQIENDLKNFIYYK